MTSVRLTVTVSKDKCRELGEAAGLALGSGPSEFHLELSGLCWGHHQETVWVTQSCSWLCGHRTSSLPKPQEVPQPWLQIPQALALGWPHTCLLGLEPEGLRGERLGTRTEFGKSTRLGPPYLVQRSLPWQTLLVLCGPWGSYCGGAIPTYAPGRLPPFLPPILLQSLAHPDPVPKQPQPSPKLEARAVWA